MCCLSRGSWLVVSVLELVLKYSVSEAWSAMARVIAVDCERSVCAVVLLCCVGVLGHAAALGTGVEGLGTRNFRVFLLIPIQYTAISRASVKKKGP